MVVPSRMVAEVNSCNLIEVGLEDVEDGVVVLAVVLVNVEARVVGVLAVPVEDVGLLEVGVY